MDRECELADGGEVGRAGTVGEDDPVGAVVAPEDERLVPRAAALEEQSFGLCLEVEPTPHVDDDLGEPVAGVERAVDGRAERRHVEVAVVRIGPHAHDEPLAAVPPPRPGDGVEAEFAVIQEVATLVGVTEVRLGPVAGGEVAVDEAEHLLVDPRPRAGKNRPGSPSRSAAPGGEA